jgi:hypothetical protein
MHAVGMRVLCVAVAALVGLGLAGCSGSGDDTAPTTDPTIVTTVPAAERPCAERTPMAAGDLPEVQGIATDATVYGLVFPLHDGPFVVGDQVKIVWRMTGSGPISITSTSPSGTPGTLTFGPEFHSGSSYDRPGAEWGAGFLFDQAGCWQIHLQREVGAGDAWFEVVAS